MSDLPMFTKNVKIIDALSMGASIDSPTQDNSESTGYAVHAIWTGAPVGSVSVQGSNDSVNFVEVAADDTAGAAGQYLLNVEHQHYRYVRVSYIRTSGTGSLTVYFSAKRT